MEAVKSVVAYGEVLWDLLPSGKVLGGAPANFAYRLNQLGTPTLIISRVGADDLGTEIKALLQERHLSTELIQTDPTMPTGTVGVVLGSHGEPTFTINPDVAYDNIELDQAALDKVEQCSAFYYGTLVQRSAKTQDTLYKLLEAASKALKVLDINLRKDCYTKYSLEHSIGACDLLKLNREEVGVVSKLLDIPSTSPSNFAELAIERFKIKTIVVTSGSAGVLAFCASGEKVEVGGIEVTVEDSVGSGDNFMAAFLHGYLHGKSLKETCEFANCVGALTATKKGGMPEIQCEEIQAFQKRAA